MTIEQNVADRKAAETLFRSMLDLARDDFLRLNERGRLLFFQTAYEHFANRLGIDRSPTTEKKQPQDQRNKEATEAIESLEHLIALCEDVPESGWSFANDVADSAREMIETIEESNRVTEKQLRAIENWTIGVSRWLR